jgi:hypothetical protein
MAWGLPMLRWIDHLVVARLHRKDLAERRLKRADTLIECLAVARDADFGFG